ncbi:MAG: hypothetical protein ABJA57_04010 [Ginsengibacter sp.]
MDRKRIYRFCGLITCALVALTGNAQNGKGTNINYTSFTVSTQHNRIMLDWNTDSKVATNYFEIQRSSDGMNYKTIALVLGPDPMKPNCDCYGCFDKLPVKRNAKTYYRIKHIDINGTAQFSQSRELAGS